MSDLSAMVILRYKNKHSQIIHEDLVSLFLSYNYDGDMSVATRDLLRLLQKSLALNAEVYAQEVRRKDK